MERPPSFTLRVETHQPRCKLVFEPMGTEYDLTVRDHVLVHVYGHADESDIDVMHEPGAIFLFIPSEYRAWNKAGTELRV